MIYNVFYLPHVLITLNVTCQGRFIWGTYYTSRCWLRRYRLLLRELDGLARALRAREVREGRLRWPRVRFVSSLLRQTLVRARSRLYRSRFFSLKYMSTHLAAFFLNLLTPYKSYAILHRYKLRSCHCWKTSFLIRMLFLL